MNPQKKSYDQLADAILDATIPPGMPGTYVWGIVQTGPDATTPPTLTATLGGSPSPVSNIAFNANYAPNAGDKVLILEMGSDRFVICAQAS